MTRHRTQRFAVTYQVAGSLNLPAQAIPRMASPFSLRVNGRSPWASMCSRPPQLTNRNDPGGMLAGQLMASDQRLARVSTTSSLVHLADADFDGFGGLVVR